MGRHDPIVQRFSGYRNWLIHCQAQSIVRHGMDRQSPLVLGILLLQQVHQRPDQMFLSPGCQLLWCARTQLLQRQGLSPE
jgi:hypothetical protein